MFDMIGGAVCHQLPERTLSVGGRLLPVCARCTGLYMGVFIGALFLVLNRGYKGNKPFDAAGACIIALALLPMILDAVTSYAPLRGTTNFIRILTGALFGACIPVLYTLALRFNVHGGNDRVIAQWPELAGLFAISAAFAALLYKGLFGGWFSISVVVCASIVLVWAGVIALCGRLLKGGNLFGQ